MSRIIAYDMCRLFIGPWFATPRGIDRVDLAMANHLFADPDSPHIAILPTPLGVRAYPARSARMVLDHLRGVWGETAEAESDARLGALVADMRLPPSARAPQRSSAALTRSDSLRRFLAMLRHTGVQLGHSAVEMVPPGAVYLNLGQLALAMPGFFHWLRKRPDVACAMMIHDTIPLDHPALVKPSSVAHHARMIGTVAAHADGLIVSTSFAKDSVRSALKGLRQDPLPSLVRALPLPAAFTEPPGAVPELADTRYFMVVSTIEPRKNFGLLLRVWERLIDTMGAGAPHLVIVGARGLEADRILHPLDAAPRLRERVHQVAGLSTPALVRLMSGCAALLSPSLAEGFGLPLLEGIAMGVPTIASDIPSHREIAGPGTILLAPDDAAGWAAAILATPEATPGRQTQLSFDMTEAAYCADLLAFLEGLEAKGRPLATGAGSANGWRPRV